MKRFWFHAAVFLFLSVFQFSLVNITFGGQIAPNILLATVLAWMLRKEFSWVWWRAVALGLTYDLVSGGPFGLTATLLLWFAYATSFLSRRFLVEQRSQSGLVTAGGLMAVSSIAYAVLARLGLSMAQSGFSSFPMVGAGTFLYDLPWLAALNFLSFFAVVAAIRRFDRYLFSDSGTVRSVPR